jgi:ketosteroid isomerase-like protein
MRDNATQIRELIENWADAVHRGDLDAVLADHSPDIVMFDAPPPEDGVRGIAAYRETWPPFFTWQRQGALFEIVSLDVSAGEDVAFAYALPRFGTPESSSATPATGSG